MLVMEWKITENEKWICLRPGGERLDFANSGEFRENLKQALTCDEKHFVIDLSKVLFIDSTALGIIVSALKFLKPGYKLFICDAGSAIRSVFKLTKLDKVLHVADSLEAVQASLEEEG